MNRSKQAGMPTKTIVALLVGLALTSVHLAEAQQAKVPKIGLLSLRGSGYELFQRELRKLGYIEGKNIVIEFRSADNKLDRLPALVMNWSVSKSMCLSHPGRLLP